MSRGIRQDGVGGSIKLPIFDDITNAVRDYIWAPYQRDALYNPSPTCMILDSMANMVTGPAGEGIGITDGTDLAAGRHYVGDDTVRAVESRNDSVKRFAEWKHYQADVGISGTDLQINLGLTSSQLRSAEFSLAQVSAERGSDKVEVIFSIAEEQYRKSGMTVGMVKAADLWGNDLPAEQTGDGQSTGRRPESLKDLFDYTQAWHGLEPGGLGEWHRSHPYYHNPPNELPDNYKLQVNVPQIWGENTGNRQLSKSVVDEPLQRMQGVGGEYICGVHPQLWGPFASEFEGNDQGPVLIGFNTLELGITAIKYYNCYFFLDDHAPTDRIYMLHVGMPERSDMQRRGAGFQLAYWVPDVVKIDQILMGNTTNEGQGPPQYVRERVMGRTMALPLFARGWDINPTKADSIDDKAQITYAQVGAYRWKNIAILKLTG